MPRLRRCIAAVTAVTAFTLLCGCSILSGGEPRSSVYEHTAAATYGGQIISPEDSGTQADIVRSVPENSYAAEYFLDGRSEKIERAYRALYEGIFTCTEEIIMPSDCVRQEDIDDLISLVNSTAVCGDGIEPDYRMYVGGNDYVEKVILKYINAADEAAAKYRSVYEAAQGIADEAEALGSDYEKVKFFHDCLVSGCEYSSETPDAYRAYGALCGGRAVCEGYAKAFELICQYAEIPCLPVGGSATDTDGNSQLHMWNKVLLDGEWYNVDCTWDDPVGGESFGVRYDYFLLSDREISVNHTEDSGAFMRLPKADNEVGGYFAREGKLIARGENYSRKFADEFEKFFSGADGYSDGIISFKCEDSGLYAEICGELFEPQEDGARGIDPLLREYLSDSLGISYLLSCNDSLKVINLKLVTEEIYG